MATPDPIHQHLLPELREIVETYPTVLVDLATYRERVFKAETQIELLQKEVDDLKANRPPAHP